MKTIRRKIAHLMVEVALPEGENRGILIILPGLPQLQHKHLLSQQLCARGWETWSPQLSGSWDSGDTFSPENHIHDLRILVAEASQLKAIIGYSYSAGIAIAYAAASGTTTPIVLIGALLDFKAFESQTTSFLEYLSSSYPLTYRINQESLQKYLTGETHDPLKNVEHLSSKVLIFFGNHDENHNEAAIRSFSKKSNAVVKELPCSHSLEDFAKQSVLYDAIENHLK